MKKTNLQFKQKGQSILGKNTLRRGILIFFVVLALISLVFAVNQTINSFSSQTNPFDVNFSTEENKTYYVDIPMYAYVKNITINIEGKSIND